MDKTFKLIGSFSVEALSDELTARSNVKRSLIAQKDILKGKIIEQADLTWKRIAHRISPKHIDDIIGKIEQIDIPKDTMITYGMVNI